MRDEPSLHDLIRGRFDQYAIGSISELVIRWEELGRLQRSSIVIEAISQVDQILKETDFDTNSDKTIEISIGAIAVLYLEIVRRLS